MFEEPVQMVPPSGRNPRNEVGVSTCPKLLWVSKSQWVDLKPRYLKPENDWLMVQLSWRVFVVWKLLNPSDVLQPGKSNFRSPLIP